MLKITKRETNGKKVLLKLEGKIMEQWASLLDAECRALLRNKKVIDLDCAAVDFLDEWGVKVLKTLPGKQVTSVSTPGYVTELLQSGGRS